MKRKRLSAASIAILVAAWIVFLSASVDCGFAQQICSDLISRETGMANQPAEREAVARQALDKCKDVVPRCQAWYDLGVSQNMQNTQSKRAEAIATWKKGLAECHNNSRMTQAVAAAEVQMQTSLNSPACNLLWQQYSGMSIDPKAMLQVSEKILASSCSADMKCCAYGGVALSREFLLDYRGSADAYEKRLTCNSVLCSINESLYRAKPAELRKKADARDQAAAAKTQCDSLFKSGNDKAKARNWQAAKADYDQVISSGCPAATACSAKFNRGVCRENLGDLNGALADYEEAVKCGGNNAEFKKACDLVKAKIAAQACSTVVKSAKGKLDKGDYRGAADDYGKAAASCPVPSSCTALGDRGVAKERMGDKNGALADYETAYKCNPNDPSFKTMVANGRYNVGNAYNLAGRNDDAIRMYLSVLEMNPSFASARHNLAVAYWGRGTEKENSGALEAALTDYTSALSADPSYQRAKDSQARVKAKLDEMYKKRGNTRYPGR
jgi:tetratricopeptide (TPR) repeat protein